MATCEQCIRFKSCYALDVTCFLFGNAEQCIDFEETSKLVELPCKVGDTVYQIEEGFEVYPSVINRIIYETKGIAFDKRAIGKSVFLTKEEAERALKERGEQI